MNIRTGRDFNDIITFILFRGIIERRNENALFFISVFVENIFSSHYSTLRRVVW